MSSSDRLAAWFREAQQSLSIAGPICTEASALVGTSRSQIEQTTVTWSKVMFMHRAVSDQFEVLERIKRSFLMVHDSCSGDLHKLMEEVDTLEDKLESTLTALSRTHVDPAFSSENRSLRSFVHDDGIGTLRKSLVESISRAQSALKQISQTIKMLDADVVEFQHSMFSVHTVKRRHLETAHESTVAVAADAHAMAVLLESLTRHYDVCAQAIDMSKKPAKYQEELHEVTQVLETDSQQVEGVLEELYDRRRLIETAEKSVSELFTKMKQTHAKVQSFCSDLIVFGASTLTSYSNQLEDALSIHTSTRAELTKLKLELQSLVDYYEMFYKSYQTMVVEVMRRRKANARIKSQVEEFRKAMHAAHQEELEARQGFIARHGNYLPNDLWAGLSDVPLEPQIIHEPEPVPVLAEASIAEATRQIEL